MGKRWLPLIALVGACTLSLRAQPADTLAGDSRLDRALTVRVGATPLKTLLKQWSQQTGVELSADASIREYRAFAQLTNRPLREAMRLLAEAFGFEWRAEQGNPDAPPRYVLYAPPKALQQQNLLRDALAQDPIALLQRAVREIPEELLTLDYEAYCRAVGRTPVYALYAAIASREPIFDPEPEPAYAPILEPSRAPLQNP
ncbi:MAG: hypothetical protein NZM28_10365, partial [Fimbriimonadales bacterium]|nr:hypothetical protein [Fimbriimonadales bacterium]